MVISRKGPRNPASQYADITDKITPTFISLSVMVLRHVQKYFYIFHPKGRIEFLPLWWQVTSTVLLTSDEQTRAEMMLCELIPKNGLRNTTQFHLSFTFLLGLSPLEANLEIGRKSSHTWTGQVELWHSKRSSLSSADNCSWALPLALELPQLVPNEADINPQEPSFEV